MKHAKGAPVYTEAEIRAHAARTGVKLPPEIAAAITFGDATDAAVKALSGPPGSGKPFIVPKPRQNKTEASYGLILEAMKRRGEIVEYRPFGIRLEWGVHPKTGKPMVYTADFTVWPTGGTLQLHECKGPHIWPKDRIRFRGCRAEWGMHFEFQMHQKTKDGWNRIE